MKLSTNVNLIKEPFHLNYLKTSNQHSWEVFHAHQSMEFLYVYEGEGTAYIHGYKFPIVPGTLLLFQPFQLHRLEVSQLFIRTVFMFDPFPVDSVLVAFPSLHKFFTILWKSTLSHPVLYLSPAHNEFLILYEMLNQRLKNVSTAKWNEEFLLFVISILQHLRHYEKKLAPMKKSALEPKSSLTIKLIIEWVDANFRDKFMLEKLSEELHLSTFYLSHTFSEKTGSSLTKFISSRRLREACLLLETTSKSVSVIASEAGFQNASYFCRVFKGALGVTPKRYRTEVLGEPKL
ncbi:helix-turn-helix transcriptional regulator [Paenibacillus radicis (ex Xue et al. 2023)]|uniref:AraC family transcriptional regulator n=1 Tax=Paenibacillus radicis (ex Xue et al. 2023) TaxID=2972489 RepID=A0ABT1YDF8_9BACL|nr:AraC family transcriptional regulator [Paenibacillus radicis (ex Xue et al. 2023)]MCR8631222.1 AraC family transcriptional regulator [Paenibacillus radicis (ex Xue et al. 2023)]